MRLLRHVVCLKAWRLTHATGSSVQGTGDTDEASDPDGDLEGGTGWVYGCTGAMRTERDVVGWIRTRIQEQFVSDNLWN